MTRIAILPERADSGQTTYRAIAGQHQSVGNTAGEALDALTSSLDVRNSATLVIVQPFLPDQFFTAEQQIRLSELMSRWRSARDIGLAIPAAEQAELNDLMEAELRAADLRTAALLRELER